MFISVDFPAPFSPRSALTSPPRRSKSTLSFARTPGNCFVMCRSSRTGGSAIPRDPNEGRRSVRTGGGGCPPPPVAAIALPPFLLDGLRDALDLAGLEQLELRVDLGLDRGGDLHADLAEPDPVPLRVVDRVDPGLELAVLRRRDRREDGHVHAL